MNVRELMQNWNMGVQRWLRDYVYMRQVRPDGRPLWYANIMTYMVSAMWHGFYPGYYLTFFFGGLQNEGVVGAHGRHFGRLPARVIDLRELESGLAFTAHPKGKRGQYLRGQQGIVGELLEQQGSLAGG